jgi:hypothetical protein
MTDYLSGTATLEVVAVAGASPGGRNAHEDEAAP